MEDESYLVYMTEEQFTAWLRSIASIGDALRFVRREQRLSLAEAAALAGISKSYLSRLERGERLRPERDVLIALLLAAYGLPIARANRLLLFAGFAPLPHRGMAARALITNQQVG